MRYSGLVYCSKGSTASIRNTHHRVIYYHYPPLVFLNLYSVPLGYITTQQLQLSPIPQHSQDSPQSFLMGLMMDFISTELLVSSAQSATRFGGSASVRYRLRAVLSAARRLLTCASVLNVGIEDLTLSLSDYRCNCW